MNLSSYRTLGHSGLIVSPLALGTMTFGAGRWGVNETGARAIFDAYIDNGGNFIDTADVYAGGDSEEMLGYFINSSSIREKVVISTKAGFPRRQDTPLTGEIRRVISATELKAHSNVWVRIISIFSGHTCGTRRHLRKKFCGH
ncbi:aldo/keto reductase [Pseudocitrobacter faecalis]|nr:aldo/keto reductase [Pseudocitrobacter faecalis]